MKEFIRNVWAHLRWFIVVIPVNLFGLLTAFFMFPIAWVFRGLGKWSPFWIWMDDTRFDPTTESGYAKDYQIFLDRKGLKKEDFSVAYYWMVSRNRVVNLMNLFKVPSSKFPNNSGNNNVVVTKTVIDKLHKHDGTKLRQDGRWEANAELKYVPDNPSQDPWQVNTGSIQSNRTSIVGTGYILYRIGNWYSFRYSTCFEIKFLNTNFTFWCGTGAPGYVLGGKFQKIKPWGP
jgi:hypothetical protein